MPGERLLAGLVDLEAVQQLQDDFSAVTGLATAIVDDQGGVLTGSGWSELCTRFHRHTPAAWARCRKSCRRLMQEAFVEQGQVIKTCDNGLVIAAIPVSFPSGHVAMLHIGQLFFAPPDEEYFRAQAREYGLAEESYLAAVRRIRVMSEGEFYRTIRLFSNVAELIFTGRKKYMSVTGTPFKNESGNPTGIVESFRDIVEPELTEDGPSDESEGRLEWILDSTQSGIVVIDAENHMIVGANQVAVELFGVPETELVGASCRQVICSAVKGSCPVADVSQNVECSERLLRTAQGKELPIIKSVAPMLLNGRKYLIESFVDISERKRIEEQLVYLSLHDPLTGLYNRAYFEEEMRRLEGGRSLRVGIIVCDVDGLKLVNDTLGHGAGDNLLRATAQVLEECFREGDVVARIGGDEFAVMLPSGGKTAVESSCRRIRRALSRYCVSNPELPLSVSIGFAVREKPSTSLGDVYKEADNNMYREKLYHSRNTRSAIVQTLVKALEGRDFILDGHADRLQRLVTRLAGGLGLTDRSLADLRLLAQFHDIGKVGVSETVLFKPDRLTAEELTEIRRHCEIGHRIALSVPDLMPIADLILKHHEWWNGQGYPLGIKGGEIPLECRILALADAYDALTTARPYREKPIPHEEAVVELQRCAGTQFDPQLVKKFVQGLREAE